jgi:putative endonuclease
VLGAPAFAKATAGRPAQARMTKAVRRSLGEGGPPMTYVYLLRSVAFPDEWYVGWTNDLEARLCDHDEGRSVHTAKYKPWELKMYLAFADKTRAIAFEKYLKSGSGRAFSSKHFR